MFDSHTYHAPVNHKHGDDNRNIDSNNKTNVKDHWIKSKISPKNFSILAIITICGALAIVFYNGISYKGINIPANKLSNKSGLEESDKLTENTINTVKVNTDIKVNTATAIPENIKIYTYSKLFNKTKDQPDISGFQYILNETPIIKSNVGIKNKTDLANFILNQLDSIAQINANTNYSMLRFGKSDEAGLIKCSNKEFDVTEKDNQFYINICGTFKLVSYESGDKKESSLYLQGLYLKEQIDRSFIENGFNKNYTITVYNTIREFDTEPPILLPEYNKYTCNLLKTYGVSTEFEKDNKDNLEKYIKGVYNNETEKFEVEQIKTLQKCMKPSSGFGGEFNSIENGIFGPSTKEAFEKWKTLKI